MEGVVGEEAVDHGDLPEDLLVVEGLVLGSEELLGDDADAVEEEVGVGVLDVGVHLEVLEHLGVQDGEDELLLRLLHLDGLQHDAKQ